MAEQTRETVAELPVEVEEEIVSIDCPGYCGCGVHYNRGCERAGWPHRECDVCHGTDVIFDVVVAA